MSGRVDDFVLQSFLFKYLFICWLDCGEYTTVWTLRLGEMVLKAVAGKDWTCISNDVRLPEWLIQSITATPDLGLILHSVELWYCFGGLLFHVSVYPEYILFRRSLCCPSTTFRRHLYFPYIAKKINPPVWYTTVPEKWKWQFMLTKQF